MIRRPVLIALTGGGVGGKTSAMQELRRLDPGGQRWICVPELADVLFAAGIRGDDKRFETCLCELQIATEETLLRWATKQQVVLCHRGSLDPLAFWIRKGWPESEFFRITSTNREEHLARYAGIIHVETAANGATASYIAHGTVRQVETVEKAIQLDQLCAYAWKGHPNRFVVRNGPGGWPAKWKAIKAALKKLSGAAV